MSATAVIFDCDGTLADSEPLSRRAWQQAVAPYGYEVTVADHAACLGRTYRHTHGYFAERADLPDAASFWPLLARELFPLLERELEPFPDVVAAARELVRRGVPVAVASSSARERLDRTLARVGLSGVIAVTVAGDEVARGKPEPDMFLAAARRLGMAPRDCIVIEDSAAGVLAGRRAGMVTVGYAPDATGAAALADADLVLPRITADRLLSAAGAAAGARAS